MKAIIAWIESSVTNKQIPVSAFTMLQSANAWMASMVAPPSLKLCAHSTIFLSLSSV